MKRSPPAPRAVLVALLASTQVLFGVPLVAPVGEAAAQAPRPRVWLGPMQADDVPGARLLSEKFDEAARNQLRRSQKVQTTDQSQFGDAGGEGDPRVEQAERLRVAGKEAFAKGEYPKALEQLRAALDLYEEGIASVNKVEVLAETLGYLGATTHALEFDADAKDYFRRVVALVPEAEPLDEFPEAAKALFLKEKAKLLKKKRGALTVTTEPAGAEVRIDGVERGPSPVTVKDLVRGDHYVQASHAEAGLAGTRTRVKGGRTKTLNLTLSTEVGPEPAQKADEALVAQLTQLARDMDISAPFREKAEAIASQTQADCVVVAFISPKGNEFTLTSFVYAVEAKQTAKLDDLGFRANLSSVFSQATRFAGEVETACTDFPVAKVVSGKLVVAAVTPPPREPPPVKPEDDPVLAVPPPTEPYRPSSLQDDPPPDDDDDDPWYAAWWVWTIAGAAVIGGTAYGGYLLLQDEPQDGYDATVVW